eukprot:266876_1
MHMYTIFLHLYVATFSSNLVTIHLHKFIMLPSWFFIIIQCFAPTFSIEYFRGNATCGSVLTGSPGISNYDNYAFVFNQSYALNIHSCNSDIDIGIMVIIDGHVRHEKYCALGHFCGTCYTGNAPSAENFTMPITYSKNMVVDIYIIDFNALQVPGQYQVHLICHPLTNTTYITPTEPPKEILKVFVASNGQDGQACGTKSEPCATLWRASYEVNYNSLYINFTEAEIYIIDGQNTLLISWYHDFYETNPNIFPIHPCLLSPIRMNLDLIVTFDDVIVDFTDWYPDVCNQYQNIQYENQYMFHGGKSLTLNNLIIQDYYLSNDTQYKTYPFIKNYGIDYNSSIICNNCNFVNIISSMNIALFDTMSSIQFINTQFINITASANIIYVWHMPSYQDPIRRFFFEYTSFINIITSQNILDIELFATDVADVAPEISIRYCTFEAISVKMIVSDGSAVGDVTISDTIIDILYGSIYYSQHYRPSTINLNNVTIISTQLSTSAESLLYFEYADVISVNYTTIKYLYNSVQSCRYSSTLFNSIINASAALFKCLHPVVFIINLGEIEINFMNIEQVIQYATINSSNTTYIQYKYDQDQSEFHMGSFILNYGDMLITNIMIVESMCDILIYNLGDLIVADLLFHHETHNKNNYDHNALHATKIIAQYGIRSSLHVYNSIFYGSYVQLDIASGVATVSNCEFKNTRNPITLVFTDSFVMNNCLMEYIGSFYGPFRSDWSFDKLINTPVTILYSNNVTIKSTNISGYDPDGLLFIQHSSNVLLMENTFNYDATDLIHIDDTESIFPPLYITHSQTQIIGNHFINNDIDPKMDWIYYMNNDDVNCITGNVFTNRAFFARNSDITSCYRPALIQCIRNTTSNDCKVGIYGPMNKELFNEVGEFIVDIDTGLPIISGVHSNIALDNVVIHFESNITNSLCWFDNGNLLMVDSYSESDILLYKDICHLIYNDRLYNNTNHIARMMINCPNNTWNATKHRDKMIVSNNTHLVEHLSTTKINFTAKSAPYYYPGDLLQFQHTIMDKLDNVINYTSQHTVDVSLGFGNSITMINIEANGKCDVCDTGLLIHSLSISDHINSIYPFQVTIPNDLLIPEYPILKINITGCPIGSEPDLNNFTCKVCNTNYYNLQTDNINKCESCNPDINGGILCIDGNIYIQQNHWIGFDNHNNKMVSSICRSEYCCSQQRCDYIHGNTTLLCAKNRNYSSNLCSECNYAYSESINSVECVKCSQKIHLQYLLFPVVISIIFAIIFILTNMDPKEQEYSPKLAIEKPSKIKQILKSKYFQLMITTMIFKNVFYFEQTLSQILSPNSFQILLLFFAELFNLTT